MDPSRAQYDSDGTLACARCIAQQQVAASAPLVPAQAELTRRANSVLPGAIGAFVIALVSFVVENRFVFFLFPVTAFVLAVGTALSAVKNRREIGWRLVPTILIDVLATLLALASLGLSILGRLAS